MPRRVEAVDTLGSWLEAKRLYLIEKEGRTDRREDVVAACFEVCGLWLFNSVGQWTGSQEKAIEQSPWTLLSHVVGVGICQALSTSNRWPCVLEGKWH
eukprot:scaffold99528_cov56-Cyclotella_meneghiniana.AAC.5